MIQRLLIASILLLIVAKQTNAFTTSSSKIKPLPTTPTRYIATVSLNAQTTILIDTSENAERDISSLYDWAHQSGIQQADSFQLTEQEIDGHTDIFSTTTADIHAGSPVLYVPNEAILSANSVRQELGGRLNAVETLLQSRGNGEYIPHFYLMLKILVEWERGTDSPFYAYFNSLPRYFSNGAAMTLFCYTCLPPLVAKLCKDERTLLKNLSVAPAELVPWLDGSIKVSEKLWKWAYQIVQTRGFYTPSGDFCICPMADYINHGSMDHNVELNYDEYGNCQVTATADIPAGSEFKLSYGDPTNPSFFLSRYGFLDEGSPATFCKILPKEVTEEMEQLGYAHNRMLFFNTGDVSTEVFDILLYMLLEETDKGMQQQFYQAHMTGDYTTKQCIHDRYYHQTLTKLIDHVDTFLSSLDELERVALYGTYDAIGRYPRLPLILRHNEFVRQTFLTVRAQHAPMIKL